MSFPQIGTVEDGLGGFPIFNLQNSRAAAKISLLGGTVLSYQPNGTPPVLWQPAHQKFDLNNGFRRGIPICWPWFAIHPQPEYPIHGFVKNIPWQILQGDEEKGITRLELGLSPLPEFQKFWPYDWDLRLSIVIGDTLQLELITTNQGKVSFQYSGAFHTYLNVSDIRNISLTGLENTRYYCKEKDKHGCVDSEELRFHQPVNRIYMDAPAACHLIDKGYQRKITIRKSGNRSFVVWNPSATWCQNQTDMEPDDRYQMVCVESVVAPYEAHCIEPGQSHTFSTTISVEQL